MTPEQANEALTRIYQIATAELAKGTSGDKTAWKEVLVWAAGALEEQG